MASANSLAFNFIGRDVSAGRTMDKLGREMDGLGGKLRKFGGFAVKALGAATVAAGGLAAAGAVMGTKTAAGLEQAGIAFETLLGSGEKAQAFLDDLTKFAEKTPFELPGLIDAARQLIGVGQSAKSVVPTLTAWGDAAGALGLGQEQFNRIMLAVTQSMSKGKVQAEELMQMTEAGVPIWPLLAKAMGKTVPQLQELARKGQLLAKDVFPALEKQMAKDYGGSMAKQSQTLTGLWSTLMDTINIGLAESMGPLMDTMKGGLKNAIEIAGDVFKKLPGWIETGMAGLRVARDFIEKTFVPKVKTAFDDVKTAFTNMLPDVDFTAVGKNLFDAAKSWAGDLISGVQTGINTGDWSDLGKTIGEKIVQAVSGAATLAGRIGSAIGDLFGKVDWMGLGIKVGGQLLAFVAGLAIGLLTDGIPKLVEGLAKHWQKALIGSLMLAFVPARIVGPLTRILGRIPLVGRLLAWATEHLIKWSKAIWQPIFRAFGAFAGGFIRAIGIHMPKIGAGFLGHLRNLPTYVRVVASELFDRALDMLRGFGAYIGAGVREFVVPAIGRVVTAILKPFAKAGGWLLQKGKDIVGGAARGIGSALGSVGSAVGKVSGKVFDAVKGAGSWLIMTGVRVVQGLVKGIGSAFGLVRRKVQELGSNVIGWLGDRFRIGSPSKVTRDMGRFVAQGLALGIGDGADLVNQASQRLGSAAMPNVGNASARMVSAAASQRATPSRGLSAEDVLSLLTGTSWRIEESGGVAIAKLARNGERKLARL